MTYEVARRLSMLALGVALLCSGGGLPAEARDKVAVADMQKYCQGQAAEAFHVNPRDILTLPVEEDGGYTVYGQYPPDGNDVTTFECHFNSHGKWKRVIISGEPATAYSSMDEAVAEADMQSYCAGEASAAFGVRPQHILTLPLEQDPGGYVVYGQYSYDEYDVTTFECHFSNLGAFQTVYAN